MEKLNNLLNDFSSKYPQLKNIQIEIIPYNNLYIARCLVDKVGNYIPVKKGRILNVIPRKILLTNIYLDTICDLEFPILSKKIMFLLKFNHLRYCVVLVKRLNFYKGCS